MTQEELNRVFNLHHIWLDSSWNGREGGRRFEREQALFEKLDFSEKDLSNAVLTSCKFVECKFNGLCVTGVNFKDSEFNSCSFSNSLLSESDLEDCEFNECDFELTNFSDSNLKNSMWNDVYLDYTGFGWSNLTAARFRPIRATPEVLNVIAAAVASDMAQVRADHAHHEERINREIANEKGRLWQTRMI